MNYIQKNLLPNEQIVLEGKTHFGAFLRPIATIGVGIFIAFLSFLALIQGNQPSARSSALVVSDCLTSLVCCAGPAWIFTALTLERAFSSYFTTEFVITTKRIIAMSGLVKKRSTEMILSKVDGISVEQSFLGGILGYGTIIIGGGATQQKFPYIADALNFRNQINQLLLDIQNK